MVEVVAGVVVVTGLGRGSASVLDVCCDLEGILDGDGGMTSIDIGSSNSTLWLASAVVADVAGVCACGGRAVARVAGCA